MTVPTVPTKATIPETGRARYLRYLLQRCVERPQLLADGARAIASPHVAYLDIAGGVSRSVVIFSSQRSGSTLLAELLVSRKRQRLIFEPFWGSAVGISRDITRGRFIDPESHDAALNHVLRMVLSGRVRNLWVDRENASRLPRGRVIKDCWGINLAPFLAHHFPEVPLILLMRHPVATAHSVRALGWGDELESILNQTRSHPGPVCGAGTAHRVRAGFGATEHTEPRLAMVPRERHPSQFAQPRIGPRRVLRGPYAHGPVRTRAARRLPRRAQPRAMVGMGPGPLLAGPALGDGLARPRSTSEPGRTPAGLAIRGDGAGSRAINGNSSGVPPRPPLRPGAGPTHHGG